MVDLRVQSLRAGFLELGVWEEGEYKQARNETRGMKKLRHTPPELDFYINRTEYRQCWKTTP